MNTGHQRTDDTEGRAGLTMSDLEERLMARQKARMPVRCLVCIFLGRLSAEERRTWEAALATPADVWKHTTIADEISEDERSPGHVTDQAVSHHRRGRCAHGSR